MVYVALVHECSKPWEREVTMVIRKDIKHWLQKITSHENVKLPWEMRLCHYDYKKEDHVALVWIENSKLWECEVTMVTSRVMRE